MKGISNVWQSDLLRITLILNKQPVVNLNCVRMPTPRKSEGDDFSLDRSSRRFALLCPARLSLP
jgi:hypothetical protein